MSIEAEVSVVIPAYNSSRTVGDAVRSALAQSLRPLEVIVVDDGSVDDTVRVVEEFGGAVTLIRQANGGLASARSTGQAAARGDLIAWLDADDVARPERLEVQAAVLAAEPSVVIVASDFDAFGESGPPAQRLARTDYPSIGTAGSLERIFGPSKGVEVVGRSWRYYSGEARGAIGLGNFLHPPTVMLRRSVAERAGALESRFPTSEDWLYFMEVARHGHVAFIDEPLLDYRRSAAQMSRRTFTVRLNNLRSLEHLLAKDPDFARVHAAGAQRALAFHHVSLAEHLGETSARMAFPHWVAAVRLGAAPKLLARGLARMLAPQWVARLVRRAKGRRLDGPSA